MTTLLLKQVMKAEDLETQIENLVRQKEILQSIEHFSNERFDFGDIIETYQLVIEEIERLQQMLREERQGYFLNGPGERGRGEEQTSSLSKIPKWSLKYYIGRS